MNGKRRVAIVCFSKIERDARVLREVQCLSGDCDVSVIGYGKPGTKLPGVAVMRPVPEPAGFVRRNLTAAPKLVVGRVAPSIGYERWYWDRADHRAALTEVIALRPDMILANDWTALPVAVRASEATGARIVLDLHEYAPLQLTNRAYWRELIAPMIVYQLRKLAPRVTRFITVNQTIADKYQSEFGFSPAVVTNAPELTEEPEFHATDADRIRIVHHGAPIPDRKIESMVEALGHTDARFDLTFKFTDRDAAYVESLKRLAQRVAPGRVAFEKGMPPSEIVRTIAAYDVGLHVLPPVSYNNHVALPNKLFEFICAGLAVCIGPSPEMARIVKQYRLGVVAASFEPIAVAQALNALSSADVDAMKRASIAARAQLNAAEEMRKLRALCMEVMA